MFDKSAKKTRFNLKKKNLKNIIWLASFAAAVIFVFGIMVMMVMTSNLPSVTDLTSQKMSQSTKIYDRTGQILLYEVNSGEKRTVVSFDQIPQTLKDATIGIEDENFYSEPAFDWKGILRAIFVNVTRGGIVQGGSTITQQLARNAFLTIDQNIVRKVKELILAIKLNENYSKNEILTLYFNQIPYGPTIYGVEAASEAYFGKPVEDLTLTESAVLAALPKAPSYYSPWGTHQKELLNRQKLVLNKMFQLGKINKKQLDGALAYKIVFQPKMIGGIKAPHFVMAVQDYLVQKYGEDMVNRGGLKVTTTLDWNLQQVAETAVENGVKRNVELYKGTNAALVAQDAATGQILAMVGSRNYFDVDNDGNFNVATQGLRQPGSTLKPFTYMTLFQKGYSPDSVFFDVPTEFVSNNPDCPAEVDPNNTSVGCFHPGNNSGKFAGPITLRAALAQSINIPAVKALYLAGIGSVLDNLHAFGVTTLNEPSRYGLSLVLGGGEIKLADLVEAYSAMAQEGIKHQQTMVLEVRGSKDQIIESYQDQKQTVADPQYPRLVNDILSDPEARADLFQASLPLTVFPDYDVALKTGTSNDYRDAWAFGYTPTLVVGVWAGNNNNTPMQKHGGSILAAVPIWHDLFAEALKTQPKQTFNRPNEVPESKPMLNGDFAANNQIHSILFYVDKKNPLGAPPSDPTRDPQFTNWETSVSNWAKTNMPDLYQATGQQTTQISTPSFDSYSPLPTIKILNPQLGGFVSSPLNITADISSFYQIKTINVYFNGQQVQSFSGNYGTSYRLNWTLANPDLKPQNSIIVEVFDEKGRESRAETIVYQ